MLCRDADSCFWIGRNIERAEATARMVDVQYHFSLERPGTDESIRWSSILAISSDEEDFYDRYPDESERNILEFFAFDEANGDSIRSCIRIARENARSIRELISSEMWAALNTIHLELREWSVDRVLDESPHYFFQRIKDASHLFQGITNRTLMMGESRDFLDAGRFLERAGQTARILDVKYHDLLPKFRKKPVDRPSATVPDPESVGGSVDVHGWIAVLKSVGAYEAFQKSHQHSVTPTSVADFLVLNAQFPASVRHGIARVDSALRRISGNTRRAPSNAAERVVGRLNNDLAFITADEIIAGGLHEFLQDVIDRCDLIGGAIAETYLRF